MFSFLPQLEESPGLIGTLNSILDLNFDNGVRGIVVWGFHCLRGKRSQTFRAVISLRSAQTRVIIILSSPKTVFLLLLFFDTSPVSFHIDNG